MVRRVRRTVLIVAEGKTDLAFLKNLNGIYCCGRDSPPAITWKQSRGGGGDSVIDTLLRHGKQGGYDSLIALTDGDRPPSQAWRKAISRRGDLVTFSPCLEGLLLAVLGHPVPNLSADCKATIAARCACDLAVAASYGAHFPRELLDEARKRIGALNALILAYE